MYVFVCVESEREQKKERQEKERTEERRRERRSGGGRGQSPKCYVGEERKSCSLESLQV